MNSKFTEKAEKLLNNAITLAEEFGHTYIGTEHLLLAAAGEEGTYSAVILAKHKITVNTLKKFIKNYSGTGTPGLLTAQDTTPRLRKVIEDAYRVAEKHGSEKVGTEHLLYALLEERDSVAGRLITKCDASISVIKEDILGYIRLTERESIRRELTPELNVPHLTKYGRNMTKLAKNGAFDPVIGRDRETERVIRILTRKRKNNPCLLGEAGVGKTAIVEGLAKRIADGDVPASIQGKVIFSVDLSSMVAGAKYRGDFEERIKSIMDEAAKNKSVILFIDEIHSIVGAGSAEGAIDASNIMKPELARGDIQLIGATTLSEYRKYIEKDAALERRFQPVIVEEPDQDSALRILQGLKGRYEEHHKIKIADSAISAAIELSCRYFPDRHLPDKAIDLLDEACAMANFESGYKLDVFDKPSHILRQNINSVTSETVYEVTKEILGSEVRMESSHELYELEGRLKSHIWGQDEAIAKLVSAIKRGSMGFSSPTRPRGVFLFIGESGVGKTELAKSLSSELFGKDEALIRYDMSEFSEPNSISKFIGSAPGYVGYDEGNRSLEQIRRHPHSVILFDEIEKAHPDVLALMLQIFDNGIITDSSGRKINFRNAYIIMTSNVGSEKINASAIGFVRENSNFDIYNKLKVYFKTEFVNRIDEIIEFSPLGSSDLINIAKAEIDKLITRMTKMGIKLEIEPDIPLMLAKRAHVEELGARPLYRLLSSVIEAGIADIIMKSKTEGEKSIRISFDSGEFKFEETDLMLLGESK